MVVRKHTKARHILPWWGAALARTEEKDITTGAWEGPMRTCDGVNARVSRTAWRALLPRLCLSLFEHPLPNLSLPARRHCGASMTRNPRECSKDPLPGPASVQSSHS